MFSSLLGRLKPTLDIRPQEMPHAVTETFPLQNASHHAEFWLYKFTCDLMTEALC